MYYEIKEIFLKMFISYKYDSSYSAKRMTNFLLELHESKMNVPNKVLLSLFLGCYTLQFSHGFDFGGLDYMYVYMSRRYRLGFAQPFIAISKHKC